jgi:hypothetical protein
MNLSNIYKRIIANVYGDTAPPESMSPRLKGSYGIIASVMRGMQEDRNYWFMKKEFSIDVVAGQKHYDFPADVKEIIIARYEGKEIILQLRTGERYLFRDAEADYPRYYDIEGGVFILAETPLKDSTIYVNCYAYLPPPPQDEQSFNSYSDALTEYGAMAIIATTTVEVAKITYDFQMANFYRNEAGIELNKLQRHNFSKMKPAPFGSGYNDF